MHGTRLTELIVKGWLVVVMLTSLYPCSAQGRALAVEDALGRTVNVPQPVRRVIALNSDVVEVMRTLGVEDRLAGVFSEIVREPEFWGGLAELPKVGSWREPDFEAMARLEPDLIVAYGRNPTPELERKMTAMGLTVLRLDFYLLATLEKEVRTLGRILNRETEAERFCDWHSNNMAVIRERLSSISIPSRPAVYVESYSDYHAAGPGSGGDQMCALSGGRNIAGGLSVPYPLVSPEWVVTEDPGVIIKAASYGNGYAFEDASRFNARRDTLMNRPAWRHIRAVADGRVHVIDSSIWTGPRGIIGVAYMAKWIHPELFTDLEPEALHREFLETFQHIEYRGVFTSTPLPRNPQ